MLVIFLIALVFVLFVSCIVCYIIHHILFTVESALYNTFVH